MTMWLCHMWHKSHFHHALWHCDSHVVMSSWLSQKRKEKTKLENKRKKGKIKEKKMKWPSPHSWILTSFPLQDFSSRKIVFYLCQFLSSFFKYSILNFLLSYPYSIFAIYFPDSSFLLKFLFSTWSIFSYLPISALNIFSNFVTVLTTFSESVSFFQVLCSAVKLFQWTKYFIHSYAILLLRIFLTSYSSFLFISTNFGSSTFYFLTNFLLSY